MALVYTSDELIEAVRDLGMISSAGSTGTEDGDILSHLTATLQSRLVPELMRVREEYFLVSERLTLTSSQSRYRIPHRAIGGKLRDLWYVDASGERHLITRVQREDLHDWSTDTTNEPTAYYIEGNYIVLLPPVGSPSGTLEMIYYFRPGDLVVESEGRKITAINTSTNTVSFGSDCPSTWTTNSTFDIHSAKSGAEIKDWDMAATAVGAVGDEEKITFTHTLTGTTFGTHPIEVGDWVCLAGEAVIPAIPRDFHSILVRGAALRLAEALGDAQAVQIHGTFFTKDLENSVRLIESRVEGRPPRLRGRRGMLWSF